MLRKLSQRLPRRSPRTAQPTRAKAGGPAAADAGAFSAFGAPVGWNPAEYGEYYAASTPVYAAIRLRADALARPPVVGVPPRPGAARTASSASP